MDLLRKYVSTGALHNSSERCDAPRCHPRTRVKLVNDIHKWLNDVEDTQVVMWLKGSAGTGKSAVAGAIATSCYKEGRLMGAFFVSGTAPVESGRSDETRIVPTLAYQMAQNIPLLGIHVAVAVQRNPLVFNLDIAAQIDELIIGPLSILSDETSNRIPHMLILIDALDELSTISSQVQIVKELSAAVVRMQNKIPVKLLIASRSERHIQSAFIQSAFIMTPPTPPLVRYISLAHDYPANDDIRTFLIEGFRDFRRLHPSPNILPPTWPTEEAIESLVRLSSGRFLNASAIQNYIQDDEADPVQRLQTILSNEPNYIRAIFASLPVLNFIF